jgi:hypothetical protein
LGHWFLHVAEERLSAQTPALFSFANTLAIITRYRLQAKRRPLDAATPSPFEDGVAG